ncbi:MAG: hypothetical protein Q8N55_04515 [bacterium]|nr:hypothetical protein [bacterium]
MEKLLLNFNRSPLIIFFKKYKRMLLPAAILGGLPFLLGYAEQWWSLVPLLVILFFFIGFLLYLGARSKKEWAMFFILLFYYGYLAQVTFSITDRGAGETDTTALAVIVFFVPYFVITLALAIITKYIVKKRHVDE